MIDIELSENAQKLLNIAQSRPEFPKVKDQLIAEMELMDEMEITNDLFSAYSKVKAKRITVGDKNPLNSSMAYLLGITTVKPTKTIGHKKRRTYGRSGFPDIDMDFDYARRHEIFEYMIAKYGDEYVASIGTIGTFKTRSIIRRVIKLLDPEDGIIYNSEGKVDNQRANIDLQDEVLNSLPEAKKPMKKKDGTPVSNITETYETYPGFARYMKRYPDVYSAAQNLEGGIQSFGGHAAGVVMSPIPLAQICPLHATRNAADKTKKVVVTQWSMGDVEAMGLIKMDVLGIATYTAIAEALKLIKINRGEDVDLSKLPLDDPKTLALLNSGRTDGCFQAEEGGMKQTFQQIGIHTFHDLIVCIAMYRPGPMDYIPEFAKRKKGTSAVRYAHPIVERYTKNTYGIIAYQEQAMQIFVGLAGRTNTEGYIFIKGSAKKKPELFQSMKKKFISGATKIANSAVAEAVWKQMEPFQGYAFNLAHATAYAYLSFKTAYLKAHYEIEFMAARLSVEAVRREFDKVSKYEKDAIRDGIKILPVDINRSKMFYAKVGERELLRPLIVKGIGDKAAEEIIKHQPYKGSDLLYSIASKAGPMVNATVIAALIDAGLFGSKKKKAQLLRDFEVIKNDRKKSKGRRRGGNIFG